MLYLVSTPIGNLEDFTFRAIKVLKSCSYILCEDTRTSSVLLKHYNISTPTVSFHKFNEKKVEKKILEDLKNNLDIGVISDAGTPLISDPGGSLIKKCIENKLLFTTIPGPSAVLSALQLSGFEGNFQFVGFLPKKESELRFQIKRMLCYPGVSISFESPHRILKTLKIIDSIDPNRQVCIAREITKKFEEAKRGSAKELIEYFKEVRGEVVLIINKGKFVEELSDEELILLLQENFALSLKEAIIMGAKIKNCSKNELYNLFFKNNS